jgi:hypothetical protein
MNCTLNGSPVLFTCTADCDAATIVKKGACAGATLLTKVGCNAISGCCWGTDASSNNAYCGYAANCTAFQFKCGGSTLAHSLGMVLGLAVAVLIATL